jgi:hypothetical protein
VPSAHRYYRRIVLAYVSVMSAVVVERKVDQRRIAISLENLNRSVKKRIGVGDVCCLVSKLSNCSLVLVAFAKKYIIYHVVDARMYGANRETENEREQGTDINNHSKRMKVPIITTDTPENTAARLIAKPMSSRRRFSTEYVKPIGAMNILMSTIRMPIEKDDGETAMSVQTANWTT